MTPARPLAASVAVLGIVGVFAAPAPAVAGPESCARFGSFAAQSGAELIRLNRLEVRPGGGRVGSKSGQPGEDTAGSDPASGDNRRPGRRVGNEAVPGAAGDTVRGSKSDAARGAEGSGEVSGSGSGSEARTGGGSLLDRLPTAGVGDVIPDLRSGVQARKPTGPGSTDADFYTEPGDGAEDADGMPAPRPTRGGDPAVGTAEDTKATGPAEQAKAAGFAADAMAAGLARDAKAAGPAADAKAARRENGVDRKGGVIRGVLVGEAKSAVVGTAAPTAAAATRMVNSSQKSRLSKPLIQQAPPANAEAVRRDTPPAEVGPLLVDAGSLSAHARSVCATDGDATRATATLGAAAVGDGRDDALVVVPERVKSLSTTALERRGSGLRSVASASIAARTIELLDGAVRINVVRPPTLTTVMSASDGAEVRYVPAEVEVSGDGIKRTRLTAAGESVELTLSEPAFPNAASGRLGSGESGAGESDSGVPAAEGWTSGGSASGGRAELGRGLPKLSEVPIGPPLALPSVPGVPVLGPGDSESAQGNGNQSAPSGGPESEPAGGSRATVKISLGKVRQAAERTAVAAKASAIEIGISKRVYGDSGAGTVVDMEIGALESVAVAAKRGNGVAGVAAGAGGWLPVTGPGVGLIALGGGLLVAGAVALGIGMRRRRFRA